MPTGKALFLSGKSLFYLPTPPPPLPSKKKKKKKKGGKKNLFKREKNLMGSHWKIFSKRQYMVKKRV